MARIHQPASVIALTLVIALATFSCGGGGGNGGGGSPTEPPRPQQTHVIQVRDNSYEPKSITIEPGDTVRWVFSGTDRTHTVTALNGTFDSGTIFTAPGVTFERRFDTVGTWDYSCQAHKQCCLMQGSIRVGSNAPPPTPGYE